MTRREITPLLTLDPDLGALLVDEDRRVQAEQALCVAVHTLPAGEWDAHRISEASPEHLGLLVLDGVIAREVVVADTISTELLGPGDVVRPWRLHQADALLQHAVRWNVLAPSRCALLDRRFSVELARYPELNAALVDRMNERALRLAMTQAISQLNRVDRRLLALFWHLAERWGRMTKDGVALPMTLSHRMLGQLVGARRPTVSTALAALERKGEVARRADGTWLLTGAPAGVPRPELERIIPIRRRLLAPERQEYASQAPAPVLPLPPESPIPPQMPVHVRGVELVAVLDGLRARCEAHIELIRASVLKTTELARTSSELRDLCRATRLAGSWRSDERERAL